MTSSTSTKPAAARRTQAARVADLLATAQQEIAAVQDQPALAGLLASRRFTAARLADGLALQKTAREAFAARQHTLAAYQTASAAFKDARRAALDSYREFRLLARDIFTQTGERTALTLNGGAPKGIQQTITQLDLAFTTAAQPAYAPALAAGGFGPHELALAQARLDAMVNAYEAYIIVRQNAVQATASRDQAAQALSVWLRRFRHVRLVAQQAAAGVQTANRVADAALGPPAQREPSAA